MVEEELIVPYAKQALLGEVYENARVVGESYDESGTHLRVRALPAAIARLQRSLERSRSSPQPAIHLVVPRRRNRRHSRLRDGTDSPALRRQTVPLGIRPLR